MGRRKKSSIPFRILKFIFYTVLYKLIRWIVTSLGKLSKEIYLAIKNRKKAKPVESSVIEKTEETLKPVKGKRSGQPAYSNFDVIEELNGQFDSFENKMLSNKSGIGLILGARGTGKSAVGMKILENIAHKSAKRIYAMGFNSEDIPNWITLVNNINQISNNSIILVDESGIKYSSRSSMSKPNQLLSNLLLIARHKDLSILFITQNSSNIDINTIRQADYLILKPSSLLQKDFERKRIKEIYEEVEDKFKEYRNNKGLTYIYSNNFRGFVSNQLPSFWNESVSKAFK